MWYKHKNTHNTPVNYEAKQQRTTMSPPSRLRTRMMQCVLYITCINYTLICAYPCRIHLAVNSPSPNNKPPS